MEIAIPFLALAGAYVISNQTTNENSQRAQTSRLENSLNENNQGEETTQEEFTNMGKRQALPNTNIPPQNYPVTNVNQLTDTVKKYPNPNAATDKYFNQNTYQTREIEGKHVGNEIQQVHSLTGNYLDTNEFKHNNMVPFSGGKVRGQIYNMNTAETRIDNMVGGGSQSIKKIEQAPLFAPQDNIQFANGTPNMSDFYQSRVNPGTKIANVKPFESQQVGPGLDRGYTNEGSGGFNSGMEARNNWLPKTVDEMRVATNPKMEYSLEDHQGPSYSHVQNTGVIGRVEKNTPDTFFVNTQDRWLTTTGLEKGQTLRSVQEMGITTRNDTTRDYTGVAGATEKTASYTNSAHTESKRQQLEGPNVSSSCAIGRGPSEDTDNFLRSHTNYENNRSTARQPDTIRSSFSGAIGAVISPIMDAFRPTRKEEYTSNIRLYGDAGSKVSQSYVKNQGDRPGVTIKETTLHSPNAFIGNQSSVSQVINTHQGVSNQRDTTTCSYVGNVGSAASSNQGEVLVDANYRQTNNDMKEPTLVNRTNQGNTQMFNQSMNVSIAKIDGDRDNTRMWVPSSMPQQSMTKETYGKLNGGQYNDNCKVGVDRIQPDLLNAFRENPYTHSLTDSV